MSTLEFLKEHRVVISTFALSLTLGTSAFCADSYFEEIGISHLHFADLIKLLFISKIFFISIIFFSRLLIFASLVGKLKDVTESKVKLRKKFLTVAILVVSVPTISFILIAPFTSPSLDASSIKNRYAALTLFIMARVIRLNVRV